jgi:hypothetical protein
VFIASIDLKKAYDIVDRQAMWETLMYGVGGKVLRLIKTRYKESMVFVPIGGGLGRKFRVDMELSHGCVMSWLFNIFIDEVVREVNSIVMERGVAFGK